MEEDQVSYLCLSAIRSASSDSRSSLTKRDLDILDGLKSCLFRQMFHDSIPVDQMYHGSRIEPKGITHVHHFFLPRAAHALATLWRKAQAWPDKRIRHMLLFFVEQALWGIHPESVSVNATGYSQVNR